MSSLGLQATGAALEAVDRHVPTLVEDRVASRLAQKDHTLWGPAAEEEASQRLGWMDLVEDSRALLPQIAQLREQLQLVLPAGDAVVPVRVRHHCTLPLTRY